MKNTIEELKKRHAREIAIAVQESAIAGLLPIPATMVCIHSDHASVIYEKKCPERYTIAEAVAIFRQFENSLVVSEHWKAGGISCRPAEINEYAQRESATREGSSVVELVLNAGRGYDSHALEFWTELGGKLISVSVKISPRWGWLPDCEFRYDSHGNVTTNKITLRGIGEDTCRKFWSPPGSYRVSYYWADLPNFNAWVSTLEDKP